MKDKPNKNFKGLGSVLKSIRQEKGFSQSRVADRLGVTQTGISYIESGQRTPRLDTLHLISKLYETPLSEIFKRVEETK